MYGFEIPRDYAHAVRLDLQNGHTKWQDSTVLEMAQLADYDVFTDKGIDGDPGKDFKKRIISVMTPSKGYSHISSLVTSINHSQVPT
jgi:hypothetical protein